MGGVGRLRRVRPEDGAPRARGLQCRRRPSRTRVGQTLARQETPVEKGPGTRRAGLARVSRLPCASSPTRFSRSRESSRPSAPSGAWGRSITPEPRGSLAASATGPRPKRTMIGLLVVFLLSWLLLRRVAREPLAVLGIAPSKRRLVEFLVGGLFMAGVGVINFVWQAHFKEIGYQLNPDYGAGQMLAGSFWVLRAVVLEELVFRGALLYMLIKSIGAVRACLLSSLAFGVYHWFSYEVFGSRPGPDALHPPRHGEWRLDVLVCLREDPLAVCARRPAPGLEPRGGRRVLLRTDREPVAGPARGGGRVERVGHAALLLAAGHRRTRGGDLVPDARLPASGGMEGRDGAVRESKWADFGPDCRRRYDRIARDPVSRRYGVRVSHASFLLPVIEEDP